MLTIKIRMYRIERVIVMDLSDRKRKILQAIIDEYIAKLNASGLDTVMAECQKQLDEWIAANK